MAYVSPPLNPEWTKLAWTNEPEVNGGSITVYVLKENKRPVGFAPWPAPVKSKKRKKKRA